MESSIVELRPGRIADLQQRIKAVDKKLAKLVDPKPAKTAKPKKKSGGAERVPRTFEELRAQAVRAAESRAVKIHNVTRRRAHLAGRLAALQAEGRLNICFGSRKLFNAQHHLEANGFDSHAGLVGEVAGKARLAVLRARLERRKRRLPRLCDDASGRQSVRATTAAQWRNQAPSRARCCVLFYPSVG
jgi:hypothetical protein